jgi:chromosome segregation ATPase
MLPLIILGAASVAASSTLSTLGYVAAGSSLGSLATILFVKLFPHREAHDESDDEEILPTLEAVSEEHAALTPALRKLEQESIETLKNTVEASHKTRLKLNALTEAFNAQTEEMQKTTAHLNALITQLTQTNQTAEETILKLSGEVTDLRENISEISQKLQQTMARLSSKEEALDNVIEQLGSAQTTWESSHLQYQQQITTLTESLHKTHRELSAKAQREAGQAVQIHTLQETIEKLTVCLKKTTKAGEAYADEFRQANTNPLIKSDGSSSANLTFF